VGKTSLIQRYLEGIFTQDHTSTIGACFSLKQWGPYNVAIWVSKTSWKQDLLD